MRVSVTTKCMSAIVLLFAINLNADDNIGAKKKVNAVHFFGDYDKQISVGTVLGNVVVFDENGKKKEMQFSQGKSLKFSDKISEYFFLPSIDQAAIALLRVGSVELNARCNVDYYLVDLTRSEPLQPIKLDAACFDNTATLVPEMYQENGKVVVHFDSSISDYQKVRQPAVTYTYRSGELKVDVRPINKM